MWRTTSTNNMVENKQAHSQTKPGMNQSGYVDFHFYREPAHSPSRWVTL